MALVSDRSPIKFDAVGQTVPGPIKVTGLQLVTAAAGGQAILVDSSGEVMWKSSFLAANAIDPVMHYFWARDGLVVQALPTGAELYVYYE